MNEGIGNFAFAYYESSIDVEYEPNDSINNASTVNLSTDITGVIDNPYDSDYYKFTVSKRTILRYNISSTNGYTLRYAGSSDSAPIVIDGNMIKVLPGTYYFFVESPSGKYSATNTYNVNFKKVGAYVDESIAPHRAISEDEGIVFQTNGSGTKCYVNGNPIDISYDYHYTNSNSGGSMNYNITLSQKENTRCFIFNEDTQGPDVVYYFSSTKPYRNVESKFLLRLMYYDNTEVQNANFYQINCRGTGAYKDSTLVINPWYAIVLIDPDTGKLVDITEYNYFYDFVMGTNKIVYGNRKQMQFYYKKPE